jgi:hypothetical protein
VKGAIAAGHSRGETLRGQIGNSEYQRLTGATEKTATRDLEDLVV